MAQIAWLRAGDRLPPIEVECFDANGAANLTGATAKFYMESMTGASTVNGTAATVTSVNPGRVRYSWGASDTTTPGVFRAWFEITQSGLRASFPNRGGDGELLVIITEGT
jgi:hypothetical protein